MAQLRLELKKAELMREELANELKKSEANRLKLLAQLREYQAIRVEPGVSDSEDVMKCMHMKVNEIVRDCFWMLLQWNLSKTATCGPVLADLYREVAALQR